MSCVGMVGDGRGDNREWQGQWLKTTRGGATTELLRGSGWSRRRRGMAEAVVGNYAGHDGGRVSRTAKLAATDLAWRRRVRVEELSETRRRALG